MHRLFLILFCCCSLSALAQQPTTGNFDPIPDSVTSSPSSIAKWLVNHHQGNQTNILKSIYGWMAGNVKYDMVNTFLPDYYKDTSDAINKTLKTRIAVCQGYAALFMEIARQAHIPAQIIAGYTFTQGKQDNSSHAWTAVYVNNSWKLVDPTWGSGGIINGKYTQQLNWNYFLVEPEKFIKTHVPFDPLFQFLDIPWSHPDIANGTRTDKPVFKYQDTLAKYNRFSAYEKAENAATRIADYGVTNQLIGVELQHLRNVIAVGKQNVLVDEHNLQVNKVNKLGSQYNEVVASFNEYVEFKNHQFTPSKPDQEIKDWIDGLYTKLTEQQQQLAAIQPANNTIATNIGELKAAVTELRKKVIEEQAFVTKYIKTSKLFRKTMFYKIGR
ncbi:hypothetical protein DVR12_16910 [Chitinophaga silvatica]|uniref:Transglutaminase-like domain-containing protein n=1 Tax=Chitinophaga silvatica TaxID=2282649 RepID=A0A3E1Y7M4_9BACT|nr:transglutaminase domain-containing protein [Chitinophaga silvatica]RFS21023.1 hypothetical protein DVR12_16910 [Chitinophaga silvatica]